MKIFTIAFFVVINCVCNSKVSAAIMLTNLGESTVGYSSVTGLPPTGWTAVRFSTGGGDWQLNSLTARIQESSALDPDGFVIEVRNSTGVAPGNSVLGSFSPTSNITSESNTLFSSVAPISLSGSTDYWLVARPTNPLANYGWALTMNPGDNGQAGWSLADGLAASSDGGTSWISGPAVPILSMDATVMAASVPEPSGLLLLSAMTGAVLIRRRRNKAARPEIVE